MEAGADLENTSVIRRLSDFDNFLARETRNRNLLGIDKGVTKRLFFHDTSSDRTAIGSPSTSAATNQASSSSSSNISHRFTATPAEREMHMSNALKRQREADLIVANSQITSLESKMASQETNHKRAKLDHDKYKQEIKLQLEIAKEKEESAKQQLCRVYEREQDCRKQLTDLRKEFDAAKFAYEKKLNSLEKESMSSKANFEMEINTLQTEVFELRNELESEMSESRDVQTELETCQVNLKRSNRQLEELKLRAQEIEETSIDNQKMRARIEEMEQELANVGDSVELVSILNGEVSKLKGFGEENQRLKEENRILKLRDENIFLLKEELDGCKKINELQAKQCSDLPKLQFECEELRRQLSSWEALSIISAHKEPSGSMPKSVMREIARLQQQESTLLEKVGSLTTENVSLTATNRELHEELRKAKEKDKLNEASIKNSTDITRHLRRKLLLVSKERDMSRTLLDSYEKETTIIGQAQQSNERLQGMESLLDGYKRDIESLETELRNARDNLQSFGHQQGFEVAQERNQFELKNNELRKQNSDLEILVTRLMEEKQIAEIKLASISSQDGADSRKIHLVSNPVQWMRQAREERLESVIKENEALKQRVQVLEESGGRVADLTLQVDERLKEAPTTKDVENLKAKLTAAETKNVRMLEKFKESSKEFREVTNTLLGYNISMQCNKYKLCNAYAKSPDDYFIFSKSEDGHLELLETAYSAANSENIEIYLNTHHSIPAFLSNLTMELFKLQSSVLSDTTQT